MSIIYKTKKTKTQPPVILRPPWEMKYFLFHLWSLCCYLLVALAACDPTTHTLSRCTHVIKPFGGCLSKWNLLISSSTRSQQDPTDAICHFFTLIVIKTEKQNCRYVAHKRCAASSSLKQSHVRPANENARRKQTKYSHTSEENVGSLKPSHCSHRDVVTYVIALSFIWLPFILSYNSSCFSQKQEKLPQKLQSGDVSTAWHELEEGAVGV